MQDGKENHSTKHETPSKSQVYQERRIGTAWKTEIYKLCNSFGKCSKLSKRLANYGRTKAGPMLEIVWETLCKIRIQADTGRRRTVGHVASTSAHTNGMNVQTTGGTRAMPMMGTSPCLVQSEVKSDKEDKSTAPKVPHMTPTGP